MAADAYMQFQAINWETNEAWLQYKAKLEFLTENESSLLTARQRWFKQHVDPNYDPNFIPEPEHMSTQKTTPDNSNNTSEAQSSAPKRPAMTFGRFVILLTNILVLAHAIFALINLVTPFLLGLSHFSYTYLHSWLSYLILAFQSVGRPQFSMQWLQKFVRNHNMHYVMYCMIFKATQLRPLSLVPLMIYALINVRILLTRMLASFGLRTSLVESASRFLSRNESKMLAFAANVEVAIFFSLVIEVLSGQLNSLVPTLVYWNFLTSRYKASGWTKVIVQTIVGSMDAIFQSPSCPALISTLYLRIKRTVS